MVRFVQYWIERAMEDPAEREKFHKEHTAEVLKNCERLKKEWNYAARPRNYWTAPAATTNTRMQVADSIAKPLSPFKAALVEMDEKNIRDKNSK